MIKNIDKYIKQVIIFLFLFVCYSGFSQDYYSYFEKGQKSLNKKDYNNAIQFFTNAIEIRNSRNAYFNRGLAYFHLKDIAGFCNDMEQAKYMQDTEAKKIFDKYCYKLDTIENNESELIIERKQKSSSVIETIIYSKINNDTIIYFMENNQRIYTQLNKKPIYFRGECKMEEFININVEYPISAMNNGIQGTVIVSFIIDKNGNVTNISIVKGRHPLLDKSANDVIKKLENFTPAYLNDSIPVSYKLILPISYILE